jgi:hypothetical protein
LGSLWNYRLDKKPDICFTIGMTLRPQRTLLLFILVCITFSLVFTEDMIASDIEHDCTGEHCPVCLCIDAAKSFLKNLKTADSFSSLIGTLTFTVKISETGAERNMYPRSPVALKIRSNS